MSMQLYIMRVLYIHMWTNVDFRLGFTWMCCAPHHIPSHVICDYHIHIDRSVIWICTTHVRCIQYLVHSVNMDMLRSEYIKPCWRYIAWCGYVPWPLFVFWWVALYGICCVGTYIRVMYIIRYRDSGVEQRRRRRKAINIS